MCKEKKKKTKNVKLKLKLSLYIIVGRYYGFLNWSNLCGKQPEMEVNYINMDLSLYLV